MGGPRRHPEQGSEGSKEHPGAAGPTRSITGPTHGVCRRPGTAARRRREVFGARRGGVTRGPSCPTARGGTRSGRGCPRAAADRPGRDSTRADGPDLALAPLLAVLAVTAGFGVQYLLWPVALLLARGGWNTWCYLWPAAAYAAYDYLRLIPLGASPHHDLVLQSAISITVCVGAVVALPWSGRRGRLATPAAPPGLTILDTSGHQLPGRSGASLTPRAAKYRPA